ncbi:MAG: Methylthioribose-1-phosphate isomerase [Alphaproteobacteria bacterium MarineAlpha2_Bin1]|nr:MAG: Methylthioribose-1-phosphate isomerase [Alphaproteobacteria bacterium MarineAlpha2_Bin1]
MKIKNKYYNTIWFNYEKKVVEIIDQNQLPFSFKIKPLSTFEEAFNSIKNMNVRGAPLIGATAAFALYLSYKNNKNLDKLINDSKKLISARPTAINLAWAVNRVINKIKINQDKISENFFLNEALLICREDIEACKNIGVHGFKLIKEIALTKKNKPINILTHCNAGWLATIDWGTALSPIYLANQNGIDVHVWVDETRPRNQGASLTSFELNEERIENTIITDNAGGYLMQKGMVDLCITGADRITKYGYVINKIGTYLKALAAKENNIPFYVAAPISTIDWCTNDFTKIKIENRDSKELSSIEGIDNLGKKVTVNIYPEKSKSFNPAFDITPNYLIDNLITEKGIIIPTESEVIKLK